jgi:hypothetical protein
MYQLGVSEGTQSKRVEKYLETKYMNLDYEKRNDGDGFIMFMFPSLDEEEFRNVVFKLKRVDGVTLMGVDSQLTEKSIMKLANLINEFAPTTEDKRRPKWLEKLIDMDKIWKKKEYRDDVDKWTQYSMDLSDLIDAWEKELDDEEREREEKERTAGMEPISEQKIRKLIRKTIRQ